MVTMNDLRRRSCNVAFHPHRFLPIEPLMKQDVTSIPHWGNLIHSDGASGAYCSFVLLFWYVPTCDWTLTPPTDRGIWVFQLNSPIRIRCSSLNSLPVILPRPTISSLNGLFLIVPVLPSGTWISAKPRWIVRVGKISDISVLDGPCWSAASRGSWLHT